MESCGRGSSGRQRAVVSKTDVRHQASMCKTLGEKVTSLGAVVVNLYEVQGERQGTGATFSGVHTPRYVRKNGGAQQSSPCFYYFLSMSASLLS